MSWYGCLRFLQKSLVPIVWKTSMKEMTRTWEHESILYYVLPWMNLSLLCHNMRYGGLVLKLLERIGKKKMKTSTETLHHTSMHGCCKTGLCWAEESCSEYEKVWGYGQTALRLGQYDWLNQLMTIMQFETNPSPTQDSNTACCAAMHYPL